MTNPQLHAASTLAEGDSLSIPGLPNVRMKILKSFAKGTDWIIETTSGIITVPSPDRQFWAFKKEDLNG